MSKLLEERESGTYYLGDLPAAKAYLRNYYGKSLRAFLRGDGVYIVGEWYSPDEWYDESELREALAEYITEGGEA